MLVSNHDFLVLINELVFKWKIDNEINDVMQWNEQAQGLIEDKEYEKVMENPFPSEESLKKVTIFRKLTGDLKPAFSQNIDFLQWTKTFHEFITGKEESLKPTPNPTNTAYSPAWLKKDPLLSDLLKIKHESLKLWKI